MTSKNVVNRDGPFRRLALIALVLAFVLLACGDDDGEDATDSDESVTTEDAEDAQSVAPDQEDIASDDDAEEAASTSSQFPIVIEHGHGTTTIDASPERIVALGGAEADALVALGVVPVAVPGSPALGGGVVPWWSDAIDPESTTVLSIDASGGYNLEEIAALEPDLILGVSAVLDANNYELMSDIAPTVPYLTQPFQDSWQDVTLTVGAAVGQAEEAEAVLADVDAEMEQLRADAPGLDGSTYTFNVVPAPGVVISVTEPADPANRFLAELGLSIAPSVADLPRDPTTGAAISPEEIGLIDADLVLLFGVSPEATEALLADPVFSATGAVEDGRVIQLTGEQAIAIRSPGALAVPWLIGELGTELGDATE